MNHYNTPEKTNPWVSLRFAFFGISTNDQRARSRESPPFAKSSRGPQKLDPGRCGRSGRGNGQGHGGLEKATGTVFVWIFGVVFGFSGLSCEPATCAWLEVSMGVKEGYPFGLFGICWAWYRIIWDYFWDYLAILGLFGCGSQPKILFWGWLVLCTLLLILCLFGSLLGYFCALGAWRSLKHVKDCRITTELILRLQGFFLQSIQRCFSYSLDEVSQEFAKFSHDGDSLTW